MIVLLAPDGGRVYIPDGERHVVPDLLEAGYVQLSPAVEPEADEDDMEPEPNGIDVSEMTVADIRTWLATDPPPMRILKAYHEESAGKHRKGALDALQDQLGNGEGTD